MVGIVDPGRPDRSQCMTIRLAILAAILGLGTVSGAEAKPRPAPAKQEHLALMEAALPRAATARPQQARRLLVFSRCEGFVHPSIPLGEATLVRLGEVTGAYTAEVSQDMALFTAQRLAAFDAIVFFNSTALSFEEPAARTALLEFVRAGKGVAGIHAGSDNFKDWPEGQALIGGVFHSHPWTNRDLVAIQLEGPDHPLVRAFGGSGFWLREEIYRFKDQPYGRDRQRVVMGLDMTKPENQRPGKMRSDNDHAVSWIRTEGSGRAFYTSLGHRPDIYLVPAIQRHFLDGLQYALGDLEADAMPSAKLATAPAIVPAPDDRTTLQVRAGLPDVAPAKAPPAPVPATAAPARP
jgi:type 1 glutamine amidotransferase